MFVRFSELFERVKSGKRAQYDGHFEAVSRNTDQDCLDVSMSSFFLWKLVYECCTLGIHQYSPIIVADLMNMTQVKYKNPPLFNKQKSMITFIPLKNWTPHRVLPFFFLEMLRDRLAITCLISANQQYVW